VVRKAKRKSWLKKTYDKFVKKGRDARERSVCGQAFESWVLEEVGGDLD
jgi:hypothetical protein